MLQEMFGNRKCSTCNLVNSRGGKRCYTGSITGIIHASHEKAQQDVQVDKWHETKQNKQFKRD